MRFKVLLNFVLVFSKWRPSGCQDLSQEEWLNGETPETFKGIHSIIDTEYGQIEGFLYNDSYGHEQQSFSNIPYAKKPIGNLRFKPPQPPSSWEGVLDATRPVWDEKAAKRCTQYLNWSDSVGKKIIGSEDCLYLDIIRPGDIELENIYRKHAAHESTEANVVVILSTGTFMYDIPLSRQRVPHNLCCIYSVFVFVRYRLGPFGFMTTNDDIMPANLGMRDQIAALKFVQRTIINFHGDPNKVTLAGASAAAASVHLHMLSPLSAGLFNKAISVSGCALNPWAVSESAEKLTKDYATRLNCSTPPLVSKTEMRDCLKAKPALDIVNQYDEAFVYRNLPISAFAPTVDHHFLEAPPHILMRGGSVRPIPWLVSFTKEEGIFPLMDWIDREPYRRVVDEQWDTVAPLLFDFYASVDEGMHSNLSQRIREHYTHGADISEPLTKDYRHLNMLRNMVSDRLFKTGIAEAARLHARASDAKVYLYEFAYRGEFSMARLLANDPNDPTQLGYNIPAMEQGTGHMEDFLIYINGYTTAKLDLPEDKKMKDTLTWLWISFIASGVPVLEETENPDEYLKLVDVLEDIPDEPGHKDEVRWTKISAPGQYTFERSGFIGEKRFWRSVPTNDFPDF